MNLMTSATDNGQKNIYIIWLIVIGAVYLLLEFGIILAISHNNKKVNDIKWFQNALNSHGTVNAFIANTAYSLSNRLIESKRDKSIISLKIARDIIGFQRIAFNVCDDIHSIISNQFGCTKCQVTVLQLFSGQNYEFTQMIAYKTYQSRIPSSYKEKYILHSQNNNKPYHVKIFESNSSDIKTLVNKAEVKANFVIDSRSKKRQEEICQYVGVPTIDSEGRMVFLLQVDVSEDYILGKDTNALTELGYNVFLPYAQLLYATYEQERVLETFYRILHNDIAVDIIAQESEKSEGEPDGE